MRLTRGVPILLLVLTALLSGCRDKHIFPADYQGSQLHFGQGGGFTGEVRYFILLEDGRLFERQTSDTSHVLRDKWQSRFTQQAFSNYHILDLDQITYNQPGNLYYFIEFHAPGEKPHQIMWGAQGNAPPEHVKLFYQTLYQSTRS